MPLSESEKQRVETEVEAMIAELRARPTQEKEDALGLRVAILPAPEREYVSTVLLRMVADDMRARGD